MTIAAIIASLETLAPPALQEDYDNAGLLTGNPSWECPAALISLDVTEAVIAEARARNCNLVIAHHPPIFRGLKKITGRNYVEKTIIAAIKNDIAIYAIHTNLDNVLEGVNHMMADKLGLIDRAILLPKPRLLRKLYVFVPESHAAGVRDAIFAAGAGHIGNYSECSFNTPGTGTFKAGEGTHPFVGQPGKQQQENEIRIETIFPAWLEKQVLKAMLAAHPYEEVAYDLLSLENDYAKTGRGLIGELPAETDEKSFLAQVKSAFGLSVIRHTALLNKPIKRIALCGGAGSFLISNAIAAGAQAYITADIKYHEFFDANSQLLLADIGHFESEHFTIDLLARFLQEKFPTFAALKTGVATNPVNYFL